MTDRIRIRKVRAARPDKHCDICTLHIRHSHCQQQITPGWCEVSDEPVRCGFIVCTACLNHFFPPEKWRPIIEVNYDDNKLIRVYAPRVPVTV